MSKEQHNTQNAQEQYAEAIAAELIAHLKSGTAPWQKPWEPTMSGLPYNHLTGNTYSGSNTLKLMMQPYDDPRWLTYKQAQSVGAQVRKGEKGVSLIRLITHVERTVKDENGKPVLDDNGEPQKEFVKLDFPYIKTFSVFNAEQIDGLPEWKPTHSPQHEWENHQRAEALLTASGAEIRHRYGDAAYYWPSEDHIVLPHKEQFPNAGLYYATALHELGHWTGHEGRLNRDLSGGYGTLSYAREELRAEIASMMLTRQLGLPHDPGRHAAYVGTWIQILTDEPTEILKAARDADKIQSYVMGIEKEISQEPKKATAAPPEPVEKTTNHIAGPSETVKTAFSNGVSEQSPQGSLNVLKHQYLMQTATLSMADKQHRTVLEHALEKTISGLPADIQMQARINFYRSQTQAAANKYEVTAERQAETGIER
ncbi:ArdC family protein [Neisseria weaveri]|uniref:ArdC family protein n=1 Tax=Neisseria weaveri TaxID=28091 RepID=UPI000D31995D|nr:zincin-like metallopeptidase domain-containing protein [Neisseria weaveri]